MTDTCQRLLHPLGEPLERCILPAGHANGCWFQPYDPETDEIAGHIADIEAWNRSFDRPEPPQQPGPRFRPPSAQGHRA